LNREFDVVESWVDPQREDSEKGVAKSEVIYCSAGLIFRRGILPVFGEGAEGLHGMRRLGMADAIRRHF